MHPHFREDSDPAPVLWSPRALRSAPRPCPSQATLPEHRRHTLFASETLERAQNGLARPAEGSPGLSEGGPEPSKAFRRRFLMSFQHIPRRATDFKASPTTFRCVHDLPTESQDCPGCFTFHRCPWPSTRLPRHSKRLPVRSRTIRGRPRTPRARTSKQHAHHCVAHGGPGLMATP